MELYRQTVLSLCTVCLLGGMLRGALPDRIQRLGINTVLLLYILMTALHWDHDLSFDSFWDCVSTGPEQMDFQDYTRSACVQEVQILLQNDLISSGLEVEVRLNGNRCTLSGTESQFENAESILRKAGWQGEIRKEQIQ